MGEAREAGCEGGQTGQRRVGIPVSQRRVGILAPPMDADQLDRETRAALSHLWRAAFLVQVPELSALYLHRLVTLANDHGCPLPLSFWHMVCHGCHGRLDLLGVTVSTGIGERTKSARRKKRERKARRDSPTATASPPIFHLNAYMARFYPKSLLGALHGQGQAGPWRRIDTGCNGCGAITRQWTPDKGDKPLEAEEKTKAVPPKKAPLAASKLASFLKSL